jgi:hypothetical protein
MIVEADGIRQIADPSLDRERFALGIAESSVSPSSIRIVVVLPAPLGPSSPKISPRETLKLTWSTAAAPS